MAEKLHPECQDDEVFVTNADSKSFPGIGWKTKRAGHAAYDIEGKLIGRMFPVFVKKKEVADRDPKTLKDLEARQARFIPA